jgi:hypothetical protein
VVESATDEEPVKETCVGKFCVHSDGRTVWVNEAAGGAVARLSSFGDMAMIDVHRPVAQQCTEGECLDCRHDLSGAPAWDYFTRSVHQHFGVTIADKHRPQWAR